MLVVYSPDLVLKRTMQRQRESKVSEHSQRHDSTKWLQACENEVSESARSQPDQI